MSKIDSRNKVVIRWRKDLRERTYCDLINCKNGLAKNWVLTFKGLSVSYQFLLAINEKDMLRKVFGFSDFLCKALLKPST